MGTAGMRVLVLCTGNSVRSQMAEGLLRHLSRGTIDVHSAGTHPSTVNPLAIKAMAEIGIDISRHHSKSATEFVGQPFDYVITVCDSAKESCPVFPGTPERLHWSVPDPATVQGSEEERLRAFRTVRIGLMNRLRQFMEAQRSRRSAGCDIMARPCGGITQCGVVSHRASRVRQARSAP